MENVSAEVAEERTPILPPDLTEIPVPGSDVTTGWMVQLPEMTLLDNSAFPAENPSPLSAWNIENLSFVAIVLHTTILVISVCWVAE